MKAQVKQHNGTPTLFLDGKPVFANMHWTGFLNPETIGPIQTAIRGFAGTGVHIYTTDALANEWRGPIEGDPRPYDFSTVGPRLQQAVDADPQALFNLRIMIETRYLLDDWWHKAYPDELEVLSDGSRPAASYASLEWQNQVKEVLRGYVAYLREAGFYDRVIGYQICVGTCGEWIKDWSSMSPPSGDFSEPMRRYFRSWLSRKYPDDAALRAAWNDPAVTLAAAEVPSGAEQDATTHYLFRNPQKERKVIDFYEAYAELCADALLDFCRTVKAETHNEKLTGAFFGYIMELAWNNCFFNDSRDDQDAAEVSTVQRSGHLGLQKVLRSPDLDYLVSPYSYGFRGLGGDGLSMQPSESLRIHGKLYLFEEDTLMHNNFDPPPGKRMHPTSRSIAIYERNFAQVLTRGQGITWLENDAFVEDPAILPEARRLQVRYNEIGNWHVQQFDRRPSAEVAVFLDDESLMYEGNRNHIDLPLIWQQRVITLNRFGAPHDVYLLNDLLEGRLLREYKLYVFLNPFHLNDKRRQALHAQLGSGGKTALWLYAPGYINSDRPEQSLTTAAMTDLTGFTFGRGGSFWSPFMHVTDFTHPITRCIPQDLFWGTTRSIAPIFHLADPDAAILGEVVYGLGRCQPGLGIKTVQPAASAQPWHSVYNATPNLPPQLLRGIARHAGVHLYSEEGDVLYATPELLAVHTVAGGQRNFKLPREAEVVFDLFNNRELARGAREFCVDLKPASTALFYTGPADKLAALHLTP